MSEVPPYVSRQERGAHVSPSVSPQSSIHNVLHASHRGLVVLGLQRTLSILPYPTLPYNTRPDPNLPYVGRGDEGVLLRHVRALPRGIRFSM